MSTETLMPGLTRTNDDGSQEIVKEYRVAHLFAPEDSEDTIRRILLMNFEFTARKFPALAGKTPQIMHNPPIVGHDHQWAWYVCAWFPYDPEP